MSRKQLIIPLVLLIIVLTFISSKYITLEEVQKKATLLSQFIHKHPVMSFPLYFISFIFIAFLPMPGDTIMSVLTGYIFGIIKGIPITLSALTCGALISFLFTRFFFHHPEVLVSKKYKNFKNHFEEYGIFYLLGLRFLPILPASVVNVFSAVSPLSLRTYLVATTIGLIPMTTMYVIAGQKLQTITSLDQILSPSWIALLCALALIVSLPPLISLLRE